MPETTGAVLTRYVATQVATMRRSAPGVRVDEPDAVHRMRVAMRRLRSALASYRPVLDRSVTDPLRDDVRSLAAELGPARDLEVLRAHLLERIDAQPADLMPAGLREVVDARTLAAHADALRRATVAIDDPAFGHLLTRIEQPLPILDDRPAEELLGGLLRHDWRRLSRVAESALAAVPADRGELLHEARKAAKRVRYAAESAAPVLGGRAERLARRAKRIQEHLGTRQDTVVIREAIRGLAARADVTAAYAFAYGRLHALEEARADQAERRFAARWAKEQKRYPRSWMS